jgi:hypothetical protein
MALNKLYGTSIYKPIPNVLQESRLYRTHQEGWHSIAIATSSSAIEFDVFTLT